MRGEVVVWEGWVRPISHWSQTWKWDPLFIGFNKWGQPRNLGLKSTLSHYRLRSYPSVMAQVWPDRWMIWSHRYTPPQMHSTNKSALNARSTGQLHVLHVLYPTGWWSLVSAPRSSSPPTPPASRLFLKQWEQNKGLSRPFGWVLRPFSTLETTL